MSDKKTPMMMQYEEMRDANPGFLLFYRMGDFYELFGEHAIEAASILGITLTQRRTKADTEGYPMCGVPFHAAEGYIAKLIRHGHKVALCEQTETPAQAKARDGSKALVKREVVRLYTGGTLTEESMLKPEENNYLVAVSETQGKLSLGWTDLSTGEFFAQNVEGQALACELARLGAKEILIKESTFDKYKEALEPYQSRITFTDTIDSEDAKQTLIDTFETESLDSFHFEDRSQIAACGALISYVKETQTGKIPTFEEPQVLPSNTYLQIDEASRTGLELTETMRGSRKGSLVEAIDQTVTPAGSRLLSRWITAPLQNVSDIEQRQNAIAKLKGNLAVRSEVRDLLKQTTDMSRSLSRLTLERGSPRDLASLRTTLSQLPDVLTQLSKLSEERSLFHIIGAKLTGFDSLNGLLNRALLDEQLPMLARDGGFIKAGFCEKFDEYKSMATGGMGLIKTLEAREAEETQITNLRIKYNKVWGYFLEVTKSQADKVPETWIHRQTTTNAQRFSTPELMQLERDYSAAEANMLEREQQLFNDLVQTVKQQAPTLLKAADALAQLDVLCSGAELADSKNYTCPKVDGSRAFKITSGRHSVVEQTVETYVSNDSDLTDGKLWLITGPNMAGKSTFLRQNALITILAHAGFFVPADEAHIGIVDKIFTRIGAGDDLAKGQSTFMMEMVETANILNNATARSLVILDEIGRGTATYDGLSIAWACVEHLLVSNSCRGLFATHYHEMTELEETYPTLENHHVSVKEWNGDIIFLHKVSKGCAPSSYGVHVGKLAGLPRSVTDRATSILKTLENGEHKGSSSQQAELPLFSAQPEQVEVEKPSEVDAKLMEISLDDLSPREAQNLLYELKGMARQ